MPKATHFHTTHDTIATDKKFRPEDEKLYAMDKQEFKESEIEKKSEAISEEEFVNEQDRKTEQDEKGES
jgi:hypothetical protein